MSLPAQNLADNWDFTDLWTARDSPLKLPRIAVLFEELSPTGRSQLIPRATE